MLVLMRRKKESILIYPGDIPEGMTVSELFEGGMIRLEVVQTKTGQCSFGIDAPKRLKILRSELYEKEKND